MARTENEKRELLGRYIDNRCSPQEWEEILLLLREDADARALLQLMRRAFYEQAGPQGELSPDRSRIIRARLVQKISGKTIRRTLIAWSAAAAAVICLLTAGSYFLFNRETAPKQAQSDNTLSRQHDIRPGGNKAILTLVDGQRIDLDDTKNGQLAIEGSTHILKNDGLLDYRPASNTNGDAPAAMNLLSTPRGGQYQIRLSDGTRVWLNAASSLKYPTVFSDDERSVEMTGEVYFEVAANERSPFIVTVGDAKIKVMGTHFNVMSYPEEHTIKTTLLEGAVQFSYQQNDELLKPGEQSQLEADGRLTKVGSVDVEKVVAWKNGRFTFDGADLGTVLRQLSRWYDVKVDDRITSRELFYASIPRSMTLEEVLKVLEMTGKVRFKLESNTLFAR